MYWQRYMGKEIDRYLQGHKYEFIGKLIVQINMIIDSHVKVTTQVNKQAVN